MAGGEIFGVNLSPNENWNIALRYETEIKLDFELEIRQGIPLMALMGYSDGRREPEDLPGLPGVGISRKITDKLKLDVNFIYYLEKNATWETGINGAGNSYDLGISSEYRFNKEWMISIGYLHSNLSIDDDKVFFLPEEPKLEAHSAAAVVADLLTVARGVASQYEIVCVNDLIKEYFSSPEYEEQKTLYPNVSVELNLEADLPHCKCSPVHIKKVLMNLINNGFEAIKIAGKITLSSCSQRFTTQCPELPLLEPGKYILLEVSDNGSGIPAEFLQHIFEPFYSKKVMGRSGTGLGLAVVWNTVLEHKGTVDVESNDKGTVFTVYLPATT